MINPVCCCCSRKLVIFGAVLISPSIETDGHHVDTVEKRHLCIGCNAMLIQIIDDYGPEALDELEGVSNG